jgi:mlo protein
LGLELGAELMLLGFISLFLTVFQPKVASICMPERLNRIMLPCQFDPAAEAPTPAAARRRRLMAHTTTTTCSSVTSFLQNNPTLHSSPDDHLFTVS